MGLPTPHPSTSTITFCSSSILASTMAPTVTTTAGVHAPGQSGTTSTPTRSTSAPVLQTAPSQLPPSAYRDEEEDMLRLRGGCGIPRALLCIVTLGLSEICCCCGKPFGAGN